MPSDKHQPYSTYRDLPLYAHENAPRYMRTASQLGREFDLYPIDPTKPAAFVDLWNQADGPVALYNLFETKPI